MFVIVDKSNDSIHQEPTRPSWKTGYYKSEGAAKAGITRTVKFYQAAIDEVAEVVEMCFTKPYNINKIVMQKYGS